MYHTIIAATLGLAIGAGAHAQQPPGAPPPMPRSGVVAPLFDNAGMPLVTAPWAIPADPAHRIRGDLYATEAQARTHALLLPGKVIRVRVGCCAEQDVADALLDAWYQYIMLDASRDMPVLVHGEDRSLAARVANRLGDAGFAPVFLVTVP